MNRSLVPSSKENKQKFKSSIKWKTLDPEFLEVSCLMKKNNKSLLNLIIFLYNKSIGV